MWRVLLSASAIVFDVVMLVLMALAVIGMATSMSGRPAPGSVAGAGTPDNPTAAMVVIVVLIVGLALNILAVLMGARPRWGRKAGPSEVVETFS